MNGDHPTPDKSVSRRRKASRMNRPRSASVAKYRGGKATQQQQQQQRTSSRMRGGGDRSTRDSGSSSAPSLLRQSGSTVTAVAHTSDGDPPAAGNSMNGFFGDEQDSDPAGAAHDVDGASIDDTARLLQQLKYRNEEIESRRRHLEHRCTQLEGVAR